MSATYPKGHEYTNPEFAQMVRDINVQPEPDHECCGCHVAPQSAVEQKTLSLALRAVYDAQRQQEGRNYAKEHSFEEWILVP